MSEIVLIEDNGLLREQISEGLAQAGYRVHAATNGHEGLALFCQHQPACLITDLVMEEVEGIETIRKVRSMAPRAHIIAISGNPEYLRTSGKLGADKMLLKPFRLPQLISAIRGPWHDPIKT